MSESSRPGESLRIRVTTPLQARAPFRGVVRDLRANFKQASVLAWTLFRRDVSAEHRQSVLGYFWLLLPPIASTLVWVFLTSQRVITIDSAGVAYPLFALTGTVLWTAFNSGVLATLNALSGARMLLPKVNFPHEALVYSALLKSGLEMLIAAILVGAAVLLLGYKLRPEFALFCMALLINTIVGAALGLVALPISALYPDISRGIQFVLRFGFFLTPVIYAVPASGAARTLMLANPVTPIITTGRAWLTGSSEAMPAAFAVVSISSLGILLAGLVLFKIALPFLTERLGS